MNKLFIYAALIIMVYVGLNTFAYYISSTAKQKQRERAKKLNYKEPRERPKKEPEPELESSTNYDVIVANSKRPKIYYDTVDLFNASMKAGILTREQIYYIIKILNGAIPKAHRDLYKISYKNEAHEVYCKLKSSFIDEDTYTRIKNFISMTIDSLEE